MKYQYITERAAGSGERLCYGVCVAILALAFLANTTLPFVRSETANPLFSAPWWLSMVGPFIAVAFIVYCARTIGAQRRGFAIWRADLLKNGIRCDAKVQEIRLWSENTYEIKVEYFSYRLQTRQLITLPQVKIDQLDPMRPLVCDVFESRTPQEQIDYDSQLVRISGNTIQLSLNPFKLFSTVHKKYHRASYGNAIAENFRYAPTDAK